MINALMLKFAALYTLPRLNAVQGLCNARRFLGWNYSEPFEYGLCAGVTEESVRQVEGSSGPSRDHL